MLTLSLASNDDLDTLIPLVLDHIKSGPYKNFIPDYSKIEEVLISLITLPESLVLLVKDDDVLAGFILGSSQEMMFSRQKLAYEIGLYVSPEYRKSKAFDMLRTAYEYWAKKVSCVAAVLSDMKNEHSDRLEKVYERLEYTLTERSYLKWL